MKTVPKAPARAKEADPWNPPVASRAWLALLRDAYHDVAAVAEDQTRPRRKRVLGRRIARAAGGPVRFVMSAWRPAAWGDGSQPWRAMFSSPASPGSIRRRTLLRPATGIRRNAAVASVGCIVTIASA